MEDEDELAIASRHPRLQPLNNPLKAIFQAKRRCIRTNIIVDYNMMHCVYVFSDYWRDIVLVGCCRQLLRAEMKFDQIVRANIE